jgi:hypothetical protein
LLFDEVGEDVLAIDSVTAQRGLTVLHPLSPTES